MTLANILSHRIKHILLLSATLLTVLPLTAKPTLQSKKPLIVKMATLAPEGSPWHQVLLEIAQDWRLISKNKVRLRIYAGGVIGDESDMVRKMRLGQVHAAALTAEGLSYIDKGIYGLSLPTLVKNYQELDWIRSQVEPELRARYKRKGMKILAWADIGMVYWFTRDPVRTPADLKPQRIFTWAGDPHTPVLWKNAGFLPVSLSATDVLPSLQTGLIDAVSSSPLMAASSQWFGIATYMTNMPWAAMTGALLIKQEIWDQIPANLQKPLQDAVNNRTQRIFDEIRYSDAEVIEVMKANGLTVIEISAEDRQKWQEIVDEFGPILRGTLVDEAMYDRIMELKKVMETPGFEFPANN